MSPAIELQSLVNAHDDPAVIIDKHYRIIAANTKYCQSYGIEPSAVVNHRCHEISHRSATPCHECGEECPHRAVFASDSPLQLLHTHFDAQGEPDFVRIKAFPLHDAANNTYLLEVIHRLAPDMALSCDDLRMVGRSKVFLACIENLTAAAKSYAPVLVTGESGVGKELAAEFLHSQSAAASGPYIEVNCAAIAEAVCESELFGHERGAFTGAVASRKGLYEMADGGTLFLDEIGDLPLVIQAKLLRILDKGEFRRVGGETLHSAEVRIVAATNRDLLQMVIEGRFRADLYYRIAALTVHVPALRERLGDIAALAEFLLKRISNQSAQPLRFSREALQALEAHAFPGNVRELSNIVQRAAAYAHDGLIDVEQLRLQTVHDCSACNQHQAAPQPERRKDGMIDQRSIDEIEQQYTRSLLHQHAGNRRTVANILGISERTLYRRLKSYAGPVLNT